MRALVTILTILLVSPLLSPAPAYAATGCAYGPPAYAWVESSLRLAERGHDFTQVIVRTQVGVPRDWPGASALWRDGEDASDLQAVSCLLPADLGGRVPSRTVTESPDRKEIIVTGTEEAVLAPYAGNAGPADPLVTLGYWNVGVTRTLDRDLAWRLRFNPAPGLRASGLVDAQWRRVTVRVPEFTVHDVGPLPSATGPGRTFVWTAEADPRRFAPVALAVEMSPRSRFQLWITSAGWEAGFLAGLVAFLLPYLVLVAVLVRALRAPATGEPGKERLVARLLIGVVALISAIKVAALLSVYDPGPFAPAPVVATGLLGAALAVVAWPLLSVGRAAYARWGVVALAVAAPLAGWAAGRTWPGSAGGLGPPGPVELAGWAGATALAGLVVVGLLWAFAVRAARVPDGRVPPSVMTLLRWSVPALGLLVILLIAEPYAARALRGETFAFFDMGLVALYPVADAMWPLVVLLLLVLLRLHRRYLDDLTPRTRWLVVLLFVLGLIRWPGWYALIPFPLAALVGLAVLAPLLRATRHRAVAVPEASRRRLAVIVARCRDLETREKRLRQRWATGDLRDAEYEAENAPVVEQIRTLRAEIGLDPGREDGLTPLDVALTRGPGASWWANARLAATYATVVGAPAAAFLLWATWSTDSEGNDGWLQRLDAAGGVGTLAADLIGGLLLWPVAGFVLGALWRELPGRRGYLKPLIPVLAYAAATGAHGMLNNMLGQAPVRGSLVRILLLFLVLTAVAVLMDARALQTRPGSWAFRLAPVVAVYRLGAAGSGVALIVAQAAAILGLWTQLRHGVDITSQVERTTPVSVNADDAAQIVRGPVLR
ncbi:DUF6185 family protein [Planotetraspora sp. GP83]|uniref:DUF6185 family protein n=1 Tax=Planotetraspora sp. GP83 TaxID=3156264 RepID=UPI0035158AF9